MVLSQHSRLENWPVREERDILFVRTNRITFYYPNHSFQRQKIVHSPWSRENGLINNVENLNPDQESRKHSFRNIYSLHTSFKGNSRLHTYLVRLALIS